MYLLILLKDSKTKYSLTNYTKYEIGDETSNGWQVIDKRFYYNGSFLSLQELSIQYWEDFNKKYKALRKKKVFPLNFNFGKKGNYYSSRKGLFPFLYNNRKD